MQAILLFVLFGVFTSVVGSIIGLNSSSVPAMIQQQKQQQDKIFNNVRTIITGRLVPEYLESPGSSSRADIGTYLCSRPEIRQVLTCQGSVAQDYWGRNLSGYMLRVASVPFNSNSANGIYVINAPVTGYVLVSAGPDGRLDPRLSQDIAALSSSSSLNSLMRISAYRDASASPSNDSLDDNVMTFSDQGAQSRNWQLVQNSLNRIALAAMRNYQTQFNRYSANLKGNYSNSFTSGPVNIDDTLLNKWQNGGSGGSVPTFANTDAYQLGVDGEKAFIERNPGGASTAGNFRVNIANSGANSLDVYVTVNNPLPWQINGSNNCGASKPVNCMRIKVGA